jgi:transcriptional regulator NrdR family protein
MEFAEPWFSIEKFGVAIVDSIVAELKCELSEKHLLCNQPITVVARRKDCDDVLLKFGTPNEKFAVVHLTFSGKRETNSNFPRTKIYDSFKDFVKNKMQPDAIEFSN